MDFVIKKIVKKTVLKMFPESEPELVKITGERNNDFLSISVLDKKSQTIRTQELKASSQKEFSTISKFLNDNDSICLICPFEKGKKVIIKLTNDGKTELL